VIDGTVPTTGPAAGAFVEVGKRLVDGDPATLTLKDLLPSGANPEKFRIRAGGSVEYSAQDFGKTLAEVNPRDEDLVFEIEPARINPAAADWSAVS
jgi:hypothetical protein